MKFFFKGFNYFIDEVTAYLNLVYRKPKTVNKIQY